MGLGRPRHGSPGDGSPRHQEVFLELRTERVILGDEIGQELVQAGREGLVEAAISKARIALAGEPPA